MQSKRACWRKTNLVLSTLCAFTLLLLALFRLALGEPAPIALEPLDEGVLVAQLCFELGTGRLRGDELALYRGLCEVGGKCLRALLSFCGGELGIWHGGRRETRWSEAET